MKDLNFRKGDAKTEAFGSDRMLQPSPVEKIPDGPTTPEVAYQMVKDETFAQTQPRLNLATFVTTYMDEYATKLMNEAININYIDETEYPRIAVMNGKCINIVANLWNSPEKDTWKTGALAIGSSEACMLGGVAAWLRWRKKRQAQGKPFDKPNFVISTGFQVVWEKFAQLWQIEMREVPLTLDKTTLDPEEALKMCDENTICIVPIQGVTWTGLNDDVEALDKALDAYNAKTGYDIPIHVDAASGGFILPFLYPETKWDFRLKWVLSISVSGHKFGLVYPGLGWVVWKGKEYLPEEMSFSVNYLGANITQVGLNFSRPAAQILGQYYQFIRLGFQGYKEVQYNSLQIAKYIHDEIAKMAPFVNYSNEVVNPLFIWYLKPEYAIDETEYPRIAVMNGKCINIVANLWNSPEKDTWKTGALAIGSSEACMLGGVAAWLRWRKKRQAQGKPFDKPNFVISTGFQVVWEKFAQLWQIEMREVPLTLDKTTLDPEEALKMCDENTICIVPIQGVTWTGLNDDVEALDKALDAYNAKTGYDIPIHVDAASGGFILPFLYPETKWDFRLKWVLSISVSGHKFGLVYPGLGWVVWKGKEYLPEEMSFSVNYLGANITQVGLNFSRPAAQILGQYYQFIRLGFQGYKEVQYNSLQIAKYIHDEIAKMAPFVNYSNEVVNPLFIWYLKPEYAKNAKWTLYDLQDKLSQHGWMVPAYTLPSKLEDYVVMRVVVRQGFSRDMADMLLGDIKNAITELEKLDYPTPTRIAQGICKER